MKYQNHSRHIPLDAEEQRITKAELDEFSEELNSVGETLKTLREAKKWSQEELAKKIEVTPDIIDKIEKGGHFVSESTAKKLGALFVVDYHLFL